MKKRISLFLVFAMLVTLLVPLAVTTVSADEPTLITDQAGLAAMSASGNYKLANDVTISGTWDYSTTFTGTLDGDGHTITLANGTTMTGGLFRQLSSKATVKNLNIVQAGGVTYTPVAPDGSGAYCVGVLAASIEYPSDCNNTSITANASNTIYIRNVNVTANITSITTIDNEKGYAVGGIVGEIGMVTSITNCTFNGSISDVNRSKTDMSAKVSGYGGIIGVAIRNGGPVEVTECVNNGNITGYGQVAGIFGYSRAWSGGGTGLASVIIERCVNYGSIYCAETAATGTAGGIAGYIYVKDGATGVVNNNINYGFVTMNAASTATASGIVTRFRRGTLSICGNVNYGTLTANSGGHTGSYYYTMEGDGSLTTDNNYNNPAAATADTLNATYADVYTQYGNRVALAWERGEYTQSGSLSSNLVSNQADLAAMSTSGSYTLANDITITGTWDYLSAFTGTLNGNGHTITFAVGAVINGGLFRQLGGSATVKDLNIVQAGRASWNPTKANGQSGMPIGGVAASVYSTTSNTITIQNVNVTATIVEGGGSDPQRVCVGGIAGDVRSVKGVIRNCTFTGSITDTSANRSDTDMSRKQSGFGGIVGTVADNNTTLTVTECINNGAISSYSQVGGILGVGRAWGGGSTAPADVTIQRCINNGTITCLGTTNASSVGGIAGYIYVKNGSTANVRYCINTGTIARADGSAAYAAGIVGGIRRGVDNAVQFLGNLQESDAIVGTQIAQTPDGSGVVAFTNNFGRGEGNSTYSPLTYTKNYVDAYIALNAAYADTYVFRNNKVTLAWADDAVFNTVTSVIGAQLSNVAGETRSIRMVAGTTDDLTVDTVGVDVKVYYGTEGASRGFTGDTDTVYTSVYAAGVPVTAASQGVDYLYTATLDNVPTSIGVVTLLIRTFHEKGGETYYSDYTAMTLDLAS
ncbi:MAG: hypothetical protein J5885_04685 [Clostridia bacterium]|nr:hypothetical protein [Clostridia bacterium]